VAEPVTKKGWSGMAEHVQNRVIHALMSFVTIGVTLGGVLAGYWAIQSSNREMMVKLETTLSAHSMRLTSLETQKQTADIAAATDRLSVERRLTTMETMFTQTLAALQEIKSDVRALRGDASARRSSP
jgi:esterase/lipase